MNLGPARYPAASGCRPPLPAGWYDSYVCGVLEMLEIKNLHAKVNENEILHGIDLEVRPGEVHAIMGPNGSGKSTLAHVLAGRQGFQVTKGQVLYEGRDLLSMTPEERAREGIFL